MTNVRDSIKVVERTRFLNTALSHITVESIFVWSRFFYLYSLLSAWWSLGDCLMDLAY